MTKLDGWDYECPLIATRSESPVRHDTTAAEDECESRASVDMPMELSR